MLRPRPILDRTWFCRALTLASALACAAVSSAASAQAQRAPSSDPALAQALFDDAKTRMAANDFATACPKFAESYRLDPALGTLVGLALCNEGQGKSATAWAEFLLVVKEAKSVGRSDREQLAREHVAALEPHLSRMAIVLRDEAHAGAGFEVKRDGVVVLPAAWRTAVPVDPGPHVIEASAPGKQPWQTVVRVGPSDDNVTVTVPALSDAGAASQAEPMSADGTQRPNASPRERTLPAAAAIAGGVGLVAIGVGAYFGAQALSESNGAKSDCSASLCTDPASVAKSHDAVRDADIADVAIGAGIVGVALAVYFALTSRSGPHEPARTALVPRIGPGRASLTLEAAW